MIRNYSLIGVCLISCGCGMNAKCMTGKFFRTMIAEPAVYCEPKDDRRAKSRYDRMAEQAWVPFSGEHAECMLSEHFQGGFRDGYSEYLYAGGNGTPPGVPPRRYWNDDWQTPDGHRAIEQWYDGYRAGANMAILQGRRHVAVVPSAQSTMFPTWQPPQDCCPPTVTRLQRDAMNPPLVTRLPPLAL